MDRKAQPVNLHMDLKLKLCLLLLLLLLFKYSYMVAHYDETKEIKLDISERLTI